MTEERIITILHDVLSGEGKVRMPQWQQKLFLEAFKRVANECYDDVDIMIRLKFPHLMNGHRKFITKKIEELKFKL